MGPLIRTNSDQFDPVWQLIYVCFFVYPDQESEIVQVRRTRNHSLHIDQTL